jgi:hypothetical protein
MAEREQYLPLARLEEEALSTDISIYQIQIFINLFINQFIKNKNRQ